MPHADAKKLRPSDTHLRGAAKASESRQMQRALRIRSDYEEGQGFDRELQEQRKLERRELREQRRDKEHRFDDEQRHDARDGRTHAPPSRWDRRPERERSPPMRPWGARERSPPRSPRVPRDLDRAADADTVDLSYSSAAAGRTPSPPPLARPALDT